MKPKKEEIELQLEYAKMMLADYEEERDLSKCEEAIKHYREMIEECQNILDEMRKKDGKEKAKETN